ncbi:MAG: ABC transporter ATPase [Capnocytophaga sp.]|nr:ABC transporter ATPase [Capnocytophaga sp.]
MYLPFNELPDTSRIWIYQSNRSFTEEEETAIAQQTIDFLTHWTTHGMPLHASFELRYHRFLIIAVNQDVQPVSGCSVDDSVRFIQDLEKKYQIDLLDKMNVSYKQGGFIAYKALSDFKKMVKNKAVSAQTIVFNNLVINKYEYETMWEIPLEESWHNRFL